MIEKPPSDYLLIRNGQLEKEAIESEAMIRELLAERDSLLMVVTTLNIELGYKGLN